VTVIVTPVRSCRLCLRLTEHEARSLAAAAAELGLTVTAFVREAVDEAIGDFSEQRVFDRRQSVKPVRIERRTTKRRSYSAKAGMYVRQPIES
jgi:uncharacterized protein (DUF1778 family)